MVKYRTDIQESMRVTKYSVLLIDCLQGTVGEGRGYDSIQVSIFYVLLETRTY